MLKGRRILITGASGYLGSWMAEYARREGADIRILLRHIPPHLKDWVRNFDLSLGDITDRETVTQACRDREVIWHTASANETLANESLPQATLINGFGTANVLEAALQTRVGLVVKFSTFHVYGAKGGDVITEETPPNPLSAYGLTNLMGDLLGLHYRRSKGLRVLVARISNGYGAPLFKEVNRWGLVINSLTRMAKEKNKIELRGSGVEHRDFVSIRDIFQAVSILTLRADFLDQEVFHIGGEHSISVLETAGLIKSVYDRRYKTNIPLRAKERQSHENASPVHYDISTLRKLGYEPKNFLVEEINSTLDLLDLP